MASGTSTATPNDVTTPYLAVNADKTNHSDGDVAEARIFTFGSGEFSTSDLLYPAIPEPASALLLVVAFGGIGFLRRKLRNR